MNVSKHLECEASCLLPALLLVICTLILNLYYPFIHIIMSLKGLQKINDRVHIRVCTFNKIYYYQCQV